MAKSRQITVGDPLVRFSTIYEVFEIKERRRKELTERVIYFKPVYETRKNDTLVCCIPETNLERTNIRQPMKKTEIDAMLKELSSPEVERISFKRQSVHRRLNENEATELVLILKNLWIDKQDEDRNFTISKKTMFAGAKKRLAQEVAYVLSLSIEKAEALIEKHLSAAGEMHFAAE